MLENLLNEFGIEMYVKGNGYTIFYVPTKIVDAFYPRTRTQAFILCYTVDCSAVTSKKWIFHVKEL